MDKSEHEIHNTQSNILIHGVSYKDIGMICVGVNVQGNMSN